MTERTPASAGGAAFLRDAAARGGGTRKAPFWAPPPSCGCPERSLGPGPPRPCANARCGLAQVSGCTSGFPAAPAAAFLLALAAAGLLRSSVPPRGPALPPAKEDTVHTGAEPCLLREGVGASWGHLAAGTGDHLRSAHSGPRSRRLWMMQTCGLCPSLGGDVTGLQVPPLHRFHLDVSSRSQVPPRRRRGARSACCSPRESPPPRWGPRAAECLKSSPLLAYLGMLSKASRNCCLLINQGDHRDVSQLNRVKAGMSSRAVVPAVTAFRNTHHRFRCFADSCSYSRSYSYIKQPFCQQKSWQRSSGLCGIVFPGLGRVGAARRGAARCGAGGKASSQQQPVANTTVHVCVVRGKEKEKNGRSGDWACPPQTRRPTCSGFLDETTAGLPRACHQRPLTVGDLTQSPWLRFKILARWRSDLKPSLSTAITAQDYTLPLPLRPSWGGRPGAWLSGPRGELLGGFPGNFGGQEIPICQSCHFPPDSTRSEEADWESFSV